MEKRYQVFVSSTYADLKEERAAVFQTLMEMDCIPAGMELFPAADEEQLQFIQRVIDDCDYYLLIIGGRYGSMTSEGISYTEKEFDYAVSKGLKVVGLIHKHPEEIPLGKSELEPQLREKLELFKRKVATGRLVKYWEDASDLPGLVSVSLSKTIRTHPALGWVRPNTLASQQVLTELNELRKEKEALRLQAATLERQLVDASPPPLLENIAGLDDEIKLFGRYHDTYHSKYRTWAKEFTWAEVFLFIAPYLQMIPDDGHIKGVLAKATFAKSPERSDGADPSLDDQLFRTIALQLMTLGLVTTEYTPSTSGRMALFWKITPTGTRLMIERRTVKKPSEPAKAGPR